jgi:DNA-binding IclR family transcriptional regulator
MERSPDARQLKTVSRACRIIYYLHENGTARLSDIATELELTPGTVHTYLTTLEAHNLVRQTEGQYRPGLGFIPIGNRVRVATELLAVGKEHIARLAHDHNSIGHLSTITDRELIVLHETVAKKSIGKEFHLRKIDEIDVTIHCTAAGKAFLSQLPESEVRAIAEENGLPNHTSNTITDIDTLLEAVKEVDEQGFALNDEEMTKGNRAVGAPITRDDGSVEGAISISGPADYWKQELFREELPREVMSTANDIEIDLHSNAVL